MNNNILLETKAVSSIEGEFFIPSYQRGYRWGKNEVERLLEDIYTFGENYSANGKKSNYYLQPVVIRKRENQYELIDGQQRLTTLYLIYKYIHNKMPDLPEPQFHLIYETRKSSAAFLKEIDLSKENDNIDFWFISNAYKKIEEWFSQGNPFENATRRYKFLSFLNDYVKIIWYEIDASEDPISLFTRLNIGKIPLTNAELVKAMFLTTYSANSAEKQQDEFSLQWDNMEKELHNDKFWYFLTNKINDNYQTRIDLILDLITKKQASDREKYFSFFRIDKMKKSSSLDEIWRKILQTFLILKDWFENHELYHKIGYLIATGSDSLTLSDIFKLSENKTKSEFRDALDEEIKKSIYISRNYSELSYDKPTDYKRISTLLLLFNVESVRLNGEQSQWFPFDKFKFGKSSNISWSLEHIHAQQSEGLKTQEQWRKWLELHLPSIQAIRVDSNLKNKIPPDLIQRMEDKLNKADINGDKFKELQREIIDVLSLKENVDYLHSIANLALLNTRDNAALNNSTFDVKRNQIVEMDKNGAFIPFCTKNVFLKYYTPSEKNQLHFWGQADRIAYINAINEKLKHYLPEPIAYEKEEL